MITACQLMRLTSGKASPPWNLSNLRIAAELKSNAQVSLRGVINDIKDKKTIIFLRIIDPKILQSVSSLDELQTKLQTDQTIPSQATIIALQTALVPSGAKIAYISKSKVGIKGTTQQLLDVPTRPLTAEDVSQTVTGTITAAGGAATAGGAVAAWAGTSTAGLSEGAIIAIDIGLGVAAGAGIGLVVIGLYLIFSSNDIQVDGSNAEVAVLGDAPPDVDPGALYAANSIDNPDNPADPTDPSDPTDPTEPDPGDTGGEGGEGGEGEGEGGGGGGDHGGQATAKG